MNQRGSLWTLPTWCGLRLLTPLTSVCTLAFLHPRRRPLSSSALPGGLSAKTRRAFTPILPSGLLCLSFPFFFKSIQGPRDGWQDMTHIFMAVMGSPLLSSLEGISAPNTSACQWSGDPPRWRSAPCALLGLPAPVHAAWVPACAPSVCAACGPAGERVPVGVGPQGKGSRGVSFVQSLTRGQRDSRPGTPRHSC